MFTSVVSTLRRRDYLGLAIATIAVGLTVHLEGDALGARAQDVSGDALWAMMMMWWVSVLLPRVRAVTRGVLAYGACVTVECSQLVHARGLEAIRATRLGHLVLGSDFDARDLAAYFAGVCIAVALSLALEHVVVSRQH